MLEATDENTEGYNDYSDEYEETLEESFIACSKNIKEIDKIEQQLLEAQATAMELGDQKQILNKMINHNETELADARAEIERLKRENIEYNTRNKNV